MSTRYKGSIISSTAANNSASVAAGIWRSNEVMQAIQAALWPGVNLSPTSIDYLVVFFFWPVFIKPLLNIK